MTKEKLKELGFNPKNMKTDSAKITIKADVNDGDYISKTSTIELSEIEQVLILLKSVDFDADLYGFSGEDYELLNGFMPYMDNEEVHSIEDYSLTVVLDGIVYEA